MSTSTKNLIRNIALAVIPGLLVAGVVWGANLYYDLDQGPGTAMIGEVAEITGTTTARDLVPASNLTYSLGSSNKRWANIYATTTTFSGVSYSWPSSDGSDGDALTTDSSGNLSWSQVEASDDDWYISGNQMYATSGVDYIGIGTSSPDSLLHIGSGDGFQVDNTGTVGTGTWEGDLVGAQYGGTGWDSSAATGTAFIAGGNWEATSSLSNPYISENLTITGGTVNDTPIGQNTSAVAQFTTATATDLFVTATTTFNTVPYFWPSSLGSVGDALTIDNTSGKLSWSQVEASDDDWYISGNQMYATSGVDYVGVGTDTPSNTLSVQGDISVTGTTTFNTVSYLWPSSQAGSSSYVLTNDGAGGLSWSDISTTSGAQWVDGGSYLYPADNSGGENLAIGPDSNTSTSSADIFFSYSDSSWFNGGNLGIGTTSPDRPLHVIGTSTISGSLLLAGTDRYLNFGTTTGTTSYGIRTLSGTMQYKNETGAWSDIGSGGASLWTDAGEFTYLDSTTDDLVVGASGTSSAPFWMDTSEETLSVGHDLVVGGGSSTDDDTIYFDDGSSEYFKWDESETEFAISQALNVHSTSSATSTLSNQAGDIFLDPAAGNVNPGGNLEDSLGSGSYSWKNIYVSTTTLNGVSYGWPDTSGEEGYAIVTDGSGNLTWGEASGEDTDWIVSTSTGLMYATSGVSHVGIGTSSPSSVLDIEGDLSVTATTTLNGVSYTWPGSSGSDGEALVTDPSGSLSWSSVEAGDNDWYINATNSRMYATTGIDYVGVGTTSPDTAFHVGGTTTVAGNVMPQTDELYSLGTDSKRWQDLYVASSSLHIGSAGSEGTIGYEDSEGRLTFDANADQANDLTVASTAVGVAHDLKVGTADSSDDDHIYFDATTSEYLKWNNTDDRFETSNDLRVAGEGTSKVSNASGDLIIDPAGGNVVPITDNTNNLGSPSLRWANLYASTTNTGDLKFANDFYYTEYFDEPTALVLKNQDGRELYRVDEYGSMEVGNPNINATTNTALLVSGDVLPSSDAAYDLGSTSSRWANLYAKNVNAGDLGFANNFAITERINTLSTTSTSSAAGGSDFSTTSTSSAPMAASTSPALVFQNQKGESIMSIDEEGNLSLRGELVESASSVLSAATASTSSLAHLLKQATSSEFELFATSKQSTASSSAVLARAREISGKVAGLLSDSGEFFAARVTEALRFVGVYVADFGHLVTKRFTTVTARVQRMEMVDQETGEVYCSWIENGKWQKKKGECGELEQDSDDSQKDSDQDPETTTYYQDGDGDGFGDENQTKSTTTAPKDYVANSGDCDDSDASVNPDAAESCGDDIDNDCDGEVDENCGGSGSDSSPSVSLESDPASPQTGEAVLFTASPSDFDQSGLSYKWQLGDYTLENSSSNTLTKTFDSEGTYQMQVEASAGSQSAQDLLDFVVENTTTTE